MRYFVPVIIIPLYILIIDIYTFKGVMLLIRRRKLLIFRRLVPIVFILTSLFFIITQIWLFSNPSMASDLDSYPSVFRLLGLLVLVYVPKTVFSLFHFIEDIIWLIFYYYNKIKDKINPSRKRIIIYSRKLGIRFLTNTGAILSLLLFLALLYAMVFGRFNYTVRKEVISFKNLPARFDGLRIVQISDLHFGSMIGNENKFNKAVKIINSLNADLVVFTGDMVNNYAEEVNGWVSMLSEIKASFGKFSVLGNHDYGDYLTWESELLKKKNLEKLKSYHKKTGFKLLENESYSFRIDSQIINIVGVGNWGVPPFPQYGDLQKALSGTDDSFKILLSHDPTHWDAQVVNSTDIALTLSGHTHGFQFGIDFRKFKWSPVQYLYKQWSGLYNNKDQYLFVNRGTGYIGFPGRFGVWPEITLIELKTIR
ncbi:metallophosphoesterase [Bacteroidota bacterium]